MYSVHQAAPRPQYIIRERRDCSSKKECKVAKKDDKSNIADIATAAALPAAVGVAAYHIGKNSHKPVPPPKTIGEKIRGGINNIANFGTKVHGFHYGMGAITGLLAAPLIGAFNAGVRAGANAG